MPVIDETVTVVRDGEWQYVRIPHTIDLPESELHLHRDTADGPITLSKPDNALARAQSVERLRQIFREIDEALAAGENLRDRTHLLRSSRYRAVMSGLYLLETNAASDTYSGRSMAQRGAVEEALSRGDEVAISVLSHAEILYGFTKNPLSTRLHAAYLKLLG